MAIEEIPLTPDNQNYSITLSGTVYQFRMVWREAFWCLDILNSGGVDIITGIPLITGYNLLEQYAYLNPGFSLYVFCDIAGQENPTKTDMGTYIHLYVITE